MRVWIDAWQMQCCGDPFTVGTEVEWTLTSELDTASLAEVLDSETAHSIEFMEEHHGGLPDDAPVTKGIVTGIRASYCHLAARGRRHVAFFPVPGSGRQWVVHHADGYEPEPDDLHFSGYIVDLDAETTHRR